MRKLIAAMAVVPMIALGAIIGNATSVQAQCQMVHEVKMSAFWDISGDLDIKFGPSSQDMDNPTKTSQLIVVATNYAIPSNGSGKRQGDRTLLATAHVSYKQGSDVGVTKDASMWGYFVGGSGLSAPKRLTIRNRGLRALVFRPHSKKWSATESPVEGSCQLHYSVFTPYKAEQGPKHGCVKFDCWVPTDMKP